MNTQTKRQALATAPPPTGPLTMPQLGPVLRRLLIVARDSEGPAQQIVADPELLAECGRVVPLLEAMRRDVGEGVVRDVIGERLETFPQPQRNETQWLFWWKDYFETLGHFPRCALEAAMREWVGSDKGQFMPKPGQLKALCASTATPEFLALTRAKRALYLAQTQGARIAEPLTDEQRAELKATLADVLDGLSPPKARPAPRPPMHGAVDATGITLAMRETIARQTGDEDFARPVFAADEPLADEPLEVAEEPAEEIEDLDAWPA